MVEKQADRTIGDDVRRIYAALASGVVVLDAETRVVAANAAAEEILGLPLDALRGQHLSSSSYWSGMHADGTPLPVAERPATVALRTREPVRGVNIRLGRPDGTERWVQVDAVPLLDQAGIVERIVVSYVDLTARMRAEEEARVEAGRLAAIAAVQREVAASARDLDGLMSLVAERAQALTSAAGAAVELVEAADLVYRAASGMLAGSVGTRLAVIGTLSSLCMNANEVLRCDDAGDDPRVDRAACRRLGIGSMIVAPLAYEGRPIGVLKVAAPRPYAFDTRDMQTLELVTGVLAGALGQALAFAALRESEARFRALSEHGTDLLCILAPDGSALYGSPSYARVLGAPIEELHRLAGSPLGAIHPDDQEHVHAALVACVVDGRPSATLTCRHHHADGSWRTLECVATNQLGEPAIGGSVVTSRDVTARMAAEEARAQLAAIVQASADTIRGPGTLAAPGARPGYARRLHSHGRGDRGYHPADRLGARRRSGRLQRLGQLTRRDGQHCLARPARRRLTRPHRGLARAAWGPARTADAGDYRDGADAPAPACPRRAAAAQADRRAPRHRRFRDRLFESGRAAGVAGR